MKDSIQHLNFLMHQSNKTLNYFDERKPNDSQLMCIGMLLRLANTCLTLNILIPELETQKKNYLFFTISLTVRAIILDLLIIVDLVTDLAAMDVNTSLEVLQAEISNRSSIILSDGLKNTLDYIKESNTLFVNEEKSKSSVETFLKNYGRFFEFNGNNYTAKYPSKKITAFQIYKKLKNNPETMDIAQINNLYTYYTKFEHFGALYFSVSTVAFEFQMRELKNAIYVFLGHHANLHQILKDSSDKDDFISNQSHIAHNYFAENN